MKRLVWMVPLLLLAALNAGCAPWADLITDLNALAAPDWTLSINRLPMPSLPTAALSETPYTHQSGSFTVMPLADDAWSFSETTDPDGGANGFWVRENAVVHIFTDILDETPDQAALIDHLDRSYDAMWEQYQRYAVVAREVRGDLVLTDFTLLSNADERFVARDWVGVSDNIVWTVRVVVPLGQGAYLYDMGARLAESLTINPDIAGMDGLYLAAYIHPSAWFSIDAPVGWAVNELDQSDQAATSWQGASGVPIVYVSVLPFENPQTFDTLTTYIEESYMAPAWAGYEHYEITNTETDGDILIHDLDLTYNATSYTARQWSGFEENLVWLLSITVEEGQQNQIETLAEAMLPTLAIHPDAATSP